MFSGPVSTSPRLSACLIVKDEAEFLPACLESIQSVVDEIIVCDTGSSDDSVDIARRFGAHVFSFPWNGSFSDARNASLEPATGDWILWLDADERLEAESIPELKKIVATRPDTPTAYRVMIRNVKDKGRYTYLSTGHRLFTRQSDIRFSGMIHEQISPALAAIGGREKPSGITILHMGYDLEPEVMEQKYLRNISILLKSCRDEPDNAYLMFGLAKQYALLDDHENAVSWFGKALETGNLDNSMTAALLNSYAESLFYLAQFDKARKFLGRSIKLVPDQAAAYYLLYSIEKALKRLQPALDALEQLLGKSRKLRRSGTSLPGEIQVNDDFILLQKGLLLHGEGRFEDCIPILESLDNPTCESVDFLTDAYLKSGRNQDATRLLLSAVRTFNDKKYFDLLVKLLINQQEFNEAIRIIQTMLTYHAPETADLKLLAGLYVKTGHRDKAEEILKTMM